MPPPPAKGPVFFLLGKVATLTDIIPFLESVTCLDDCTKEVGVLHAENAPFFSALSMSHARHVKFASLAKLSL